MAQPAMKKLTVLFSALLTMGMGMGFTACDDDDDETTWTKYADWRETNQQWVDAQAALKNDDGTSFYHVIQPTWSPNDYILIHWFNDRNETKGNLTPLLTSNVTTYYNLYDMDDNLLDSSDDTDEGSLTTVVSNVITGWQIALMNMCVGDTVQIVVPYQSAYGSSSSGDIDPYSALRFNMRLVDIPNYETMP
jgi:hypothetical protein